MIVHETVSVERPVEARGYLLGVSSLPLTGFQILNSAQQAARASTLSHGVGSLQTFYLIGTFSPPRPPQVPLLGKAWPLR